MLDKELLKAYNQTRVTKDKSLICHAPFTNINFEQNGNATACCYNRTHVLGTYPKDTLMDLWFGDKAEELRRYIEQNSLEGGCSLCNKQLHSHNFHGMRAKGYDWGADRKIVSTAKKVLNYITKGKYVQMPVSMEFELSNTCNLECVMCNGYFSSSIRKNREKAPPLTNPYDEAFVEQLVPFLPHMRDARFLGGEPFLIDIYYSIWEKIAEHNPNMRVHITTNATILNNRAKGLLDRLQCNIILSIDSIVKETYEQIRVNAKYERVWEHIQYFLDYTRRKGTQMSMAVCPISLNWHEMPDLIRYCNKEGIKIFFNTVYSPEEYTLELLSTEELQHVVDTLDKAKLPSGTYLENYNKDMYDGMLNQIKSWLNKSEQVDSLEASSHAEVKELLDAAKGMIDTTQVDARLTLIILESLLEFMVRFQNGASKFETEEKRKHELSVNLAHLFKESELEPFTKAYFAAYYTLCDLLYTGTSQSSLKEKFQVMQDIAGTHPNKYNIMRDLIRTEPSENIGILEQMPPEAVAAEMNLRYGSVTVD